MKINAINLNNFKQSNFNKISKNSTLSFKRNKQFSPEEQKLREDILNKSKNIEKQINSAQKESKIIYAYSKAIIEESKLVQAHFRELLEELNKILEHFKTTGEDKFCLENNNQITIHKMANKKTNDYTTIINVYNPDYTLARRVCLNMPSEIISIEKHKIGEIQEFFPNKTSDIYTFDIESQKLYMTEKNIQLLYGGKKSDKQYEFIPQGQLKNYTKGYSIINSEKSSFESSYDFIDEELFNYEESKTTDLNNFKEKTNRTITYDAPFNAKEYKAGITNSYPHKESIDLTIKFESDKTSYIKGKTRFSGTTIIDDIYTFESGKLKTYNHWIESSVYSDTTSSISLVF